MSKKLLKTKSPVKLISATQNIASNIEKNIKYRFTSTLKSKKKGSKTKKKLPKPTQTQVSDLSRLEELKFIERNYVKQMLTPKKSKNAKILNPRPSVQSSPRTPNRPLQTSYDQLSQLDSYYFSLNYDSTCSSPKSDQVFKPFNDYILDL